MDRKALVLVLTFIVLGAQAVCAQETLNWNLALVKDNKGVPFDKTVAMKNGDTFTLEISVEKDCYVYLVVDEASGGMTPLIYRKVLANKTERKTITLNPPRGQEKFHVVTSLTEQKDLVRAVENYNREKSSVNALALRTILFEINSDDEIFQKGGGVSGNIRGNDVIKGNSYSGRSAYTETIIISH